MSKTKIWDTDPENKPKERVRYASETDGTFNAGAKDADGNGVSIGTFRLMASERSVAEAIAQAYGGEVIETETASDQFIQVITNAEKLEVIADGPDALTSDFKQWNNGKLVHHCDGVLFLSHLMDENLIGQPCNCPKLFNDRKTAYRNGMGPGPDIRITFRLADDPELGTFVFKSGAWTLLKVLHEAENGLEEIGGEALVELSLELVEFDIKKGPNKGTHVSYYKPNIVPRKPWGEAIADER